MKRNTGLKWLKSLKHLRLCNLQFPDKLPVGNDHEISWKYFLVSNSLFECQSPHKTVSWNLNQI